MSMADAKDDAAMAEAQPLGRWPVLSYGVGHMLNDITSACWFTYLLLFLQQIGLAPRSTGLAASSYGTSEGLSSSASHSPRSLVAACCAPSWGRTRTS